MLVGVHVIRRAVLTCLELSEGKHLFATDPVSIDDRTGVDFVLEVEICVHREAVAGDFLSIDPDSDNKIVKLVSEVRFEDHMD